MKNKGLSQHRFKDNPLEKKFALKWEELNKSYRTLDFLLAKKINHPEDDEVTDRDREVAATVVQWLGSPVGESFVREVIDNKDEDVAIVSAAKVFLAAIKDKTGLSDFAYEKGIETAAKQANVTVERMKRFLFYVQNKNTRVRKYNDNYS